MLRPCAAGRKKIVGEQRGNLKPSVKGRRFTSPENSYGTDTNHPIEKENHLNQTIILIFQGFLILAYEKSPYNWVVSISSPNIVFQPLNFQGVKPHDSHDPRETYILALTNSITIYEPYKYKMWGVPQKVLYANNHNDNIIIPLIIKIVIMITTIKNDHISTANSSNNNNDDNHNNDDDDDDDNDNDKVMIVI